MRPDQQSIERFDEESQSTMQLFSHAWCTEDGIESVRQKIVSWASECHRLAQLATKQHLEAEACETSERGAQTKKKKWHSICRGSVCGTEQV